VKELPRLDTDDEYAMSFSSWLFWFQIVLWFVELDWVPMNQKCSGCCSVKL